MTPCVQCGECAAAWAAQVRSLESGDRRVHGQSAKLCVGCGKCVEACPFGVMLQVAGAPAASKCIACGICGMSKACPMEVPRDRRADFGYPVLSAYCANQKTAVPFSGHGSFSCFRPEIWLRIRDRYDMITKEHRNIDMEVMNHYGRNQKDPGTC
ncbi:MAG: 4Fe-4S dicluster domain-containing protein [Oscillospiraceae bacterium]